jgi:hypothetical protein
VSSIPGNEPHKNRDIDKKFPKEGMGACKTVTITGCKKYVKIQGKPTKKPNNAVMVS